MLNSITPFQNNSQKENSQSNSQHEDINNSQYDNDDIRNEEINDDSYEDENEEYDDEMYKEIEEESSFENEINPSTIEKILKRGVGGSGREIKKTISKSSLGHKNKNFKWSKEEDELLSTLVEEFKGRSWKKISCHMPGRTPIQCLHRWTKILKPGLVKGPWTSDEDKMLINYVNYYGAHDFSECSKIIQGRNNKQCRERWFNVLNPKVIKGEWSLEEDYLIFRLYTKFGGKWIKFIPLFNGLRAENSIKNRFYSTIRRFNTVLRKKRKEIESEKVKIETIFNDFKSQIIDKYKIKSEDELKAFEKSNLGFDGSLDETKRDTREIFINDSTNKEKLGTSYSFHAIPNQTSSQTSSNLADAKFFHTQQQQSESKFNTSKGNFTSTNQISFKTNKQIKSIGNNNNFCQRKSTFTEFGIREPIRDSGLKGKISKTPFLKGKPLLTSNDNISQISLVDQITSTEKDSQMENTNTSEVTPKIRKRKQSGNASPLIISNFQNTKKAMTPNITFTRYNPNNFFVESLKNLNINDLEMQIMNDYNNKNFSFYDEQTKIIDLKLDKLNENYPFLSFKLDCDSNNNQNLNMMSLSDLSITTMLSDNPNLSYIVSQINELEKYILATKEEIYEILSSNDKKLSAFKRLLNTHNENLFGNGNDKFMLNSNEMFEDVPFHIKSDNSLFSLSDIQFV